MDLKNTVDKFSAKAGGVQFNSPPDKSGGNSNRQFQTYWFENK